MSSTRDTLPKAFRRQGYRSVAVMPGMRQAWPEGAFYGFDEIYGAMGWPMAARSSAGGASPISSRWRSSTSSSWAAAGRAGVRGLPDQHHPRAVRSRRRRISRTGRRMLTPTPFDRAEWSAHGRQPRLTNLVPSYARRWLTSSTIFAGYVAPSTPATMVTDPDRRSPAGGRGERHRCEYEVPVHVVARPGRDMDRLRAAGFLDGMEPRRPALGPMPGLVPTFLDAFGPDGASAHHGQRRLVRRPLIPQPPDIHGERPGQRAQA